MNPRDTAIEALEAIAKEMDCSDWGDIDMNGEGALKPWSHDIVANPSGCMACRLRTAIAALKSLEGQPSTPRLTVDEAMEVVRKWYNELGIIDLNGVSIPDDLRTRLTQAIKP